ncbi:hypothetical protein ABZ700_15120 [Streptomyces diastaticus]|uniref:hypothetical protein n=1 Tax=Streptomyces diastaticus TaxID=1956 RepID=UPI0033D39AAF
MIDFKLELVGTEPLLMHSSRLADPTDPAAKELKRVTSKRSKTDDDHEEIARLEFLGGLYFEEKVGPYIPGDNVWRSLYDAAKKFKKGPRVKEGVFIETSVNPLQYTDASGRPGPRTESSLWADDGFRLMSSVKVMSARTMRCRAKFDRWSVTVQGTLDPNVLDLAELKEIADTAGRLVGVGDWRPRYGRFTATLLAAAPGAAGMTAEAA